eukprot:snap_masked-scaffold_39-processed-gene-2.10-mRNA-1 protein AED:1.00 eAED:1.00 QI:0/0/0/0/1/1/4/0/108
MNYLTFKLFDEESICSSAKNYILKLSEAFEIFQDRQKIPHTVNEWGDKEIEKYKKRQSIIGTSTYINRTRYHVSSWHAGTVCKNPAKFNFNEAKKVSKYRLGTRDMGL